MNLGSEHRAYARCASSVPLTRGASSSGDGNCYTLFPTNLSLAHRWLTARSQLTLHPR